MTHSTHAKIWTHTTHAKILLTHATQRHPRYLADLLQTYAINNHSVHFHFVIQLLLLFYFDMMISCQQNNAPADVPTVILHAQ